MGMIAQEGYFDSILEFGELVGAIVAAIALARTAQSIYTKTIGRRQRDRMRLRRLGTNAQLSYFTSVLGEPPALSRTLPAPYPTSTKEHVFISKDYFVHAVTDTDETVLCYSVTSRSKRFHPRLISPGFTGTEPGRLRRLLRTQGWMKRLFDVQLCKTPFKHLDRPRRVCANVAARRYSYWEEHWLGNPGHYQRYIFSVNDIAPTKGAMSPLVELSNRGNFTGKEEFDFDEESDAKLNDPLLNEFRAETSPNTYTVIGPHLETASFPFGPDQDRVRTLIH